MSDVYLYANLDHCEYLMVNALGGGNKVGSIGRNLGARALGLLLLGRWAGSRVQVIGESDELFQLIEAEFADIATVAVELVLGHDGADELLTVADSDKRLFAMLGQMVIAGHNATLRHAMRDRFGEHWQKRLGS